MTIFDLPASMTATDLQQWQPILEWLQQIFYPPVAANDAAPTPIAAGKAPQIKPVFKPASGDNPKPAVAALASSRLGSSLPNSLMPAQESLVHGGRMSSLGNGRAVAAPVVSSGKPAMARNVNSSDGLQIPQFLKRIPR